MAQIKKEQLKRIINKEFAYVIKEAERKDTYFNQIAAPVRDLSKAVLPRRHVQAVPAGNLWKKLSTRS